MVVGVVGFELAVVAFDEAQQGGLRLGRVKAASRESFVVQKRPQIEDLPSPVVLRPFGQARLHVFRKSPRAARLVRVHRLFLIGAARRGFQNVNE